MLISDLRERYGISGRGTNLRLLTEVAKAEGLATRALKVDVEGVRHLTLPALMHWDMNHFVVLSAVRKDGGVTILDPARGKRVLAAAELSASFTGIAVEFAPMQGFEAQAKQRRSRPFRSFRHIDKAGLKLLRIAFLSVLLQIVLALVPLQLQHALDSAMRGPPGTVLATVGFVFFALTGVHGLALLMRAVSVSYIGQEMLRRWNREVFEHILRLPIPFFERRHLGDIVSRLGVTRLVQSTLTTTTVESIIDGLLAASFVLLMFHYHTQLALLCTSVVAVLAVLRVLAFRHLASSIEESVFRYATQQTFLFESLRTALTIRLLGGMTARSRVYEGLLEHSAAADLRVAQTRALTDSSTQFLVSTERVVAIGVGAWALSKNEITSGAFVAYLAYREMFIARIVILLERALDIGMLPAHTERLEDIVSTKQDALLAGGSEVSPETFGLCLENVSFRYGAGEPWILQGLSFDVAQGEHIAIIGPSGCGKTTLAKVILRILAPEKGSVCLGGVPLSDIPESFFRSHVAAVLQDDQLLAGSIADNIAMYFDAGDDERLELAARQADIHDEIVALPMGYETQIGDLGSTLSAGQKQRLFLARALYRRPRLLVTDEATSNLDVAREIRIAETIRSLHMTRIVIAHRTETIAAADRIIDLSARLRKE